MAIEKWTAVRRLRLSLALAAALAAALAGSALAVVGGTPDNGAHPYVGAAVWFPTGDPSGRFELCSGSLVSPTVLVTAAHCFPDGATVHVSFDENARASNPAGWPTGTMHSDPDWCGGCEHGLPGYDANDDAVIVLDDAVTLDRYAQLPAEGLSDTLPKKQQVDIVGYGLQSTAPPQQAFGFREVAPAKLIPGRGRIGDEFLKISSSPGHGGATCSGDSGGPDLLAGTDVMVAISSFGPNTSCKAVEYSYRMDTQHALAFVGGFLGQ